MEGGDRRALSARAATGARPHDGDAALYSARAKAGERRRAVAAVASSAKLAAESSRPSSDEPWSREHRDRDELLADENGAVGQRWNLRVGESEMGRVALSSVSPFAVRSGNQFVTSRARFELAMPDPPHQPRDQPQPPCVLPPIGQSLQWAAAAEKLTAQLTAEFLGLERGDENVSAAAICGQGLAPPQYAPAPPGSSASSASQASALGAPVNRSLTELAQARMLSCFRRRRSLVSDETKSPSSIVKLSGTPRQSSAAPLSSRSGRQVPRGPRMSRRPPPTCASPLAGW